jgi:hypothetical protein
MEKLQYSTLYNTVHRHARTRICGSHEVSEFFVVSNRTIVIEAV